jgi:hypothetical protein
MTDNGTMATPTLGDAARDVVGWLGQGARLGLDLLGSVPLPSVKRTAGSCDIPPPCWAPQPFGDVTTRACPGTKAVVRIDVTNTDIVGRTIKVTTTGGTATIDPPALPLGPLEEGVVVLSFDVPPTDTDGQTRKLIVWVDGCQKHYLRWTVVSTCSAQDCCVDAAVSDGPDWIHHWYDHFYCERDCVQR